MLQLQTGVQIRFRNSRLSASRSSLLPPWMAPIRSAMRAVSCGRTAANAKRRSEKRNERRLVPGADNRVERFEQRRNGPRQFGRRLRQPMQKAHGLMRVGADGEPPVKLLDQRGLIVNRQATTNSGGSPYHLQSHADFSLLADADTATRTPASRRELLAALGRAAVFSPEVDESLRQTDAGVPADFTLRYARGLRVYYRRGAGVRGCRNRRHPAFAVAGHGHQSASRAASRCIRRLH